MPSASSGLYAGPARWTTVRRSISDIPAPGFIDDRDTIAGAQAVGASVDHLDGLIQVPDAAGRFYPRATGDCILHQLHVVRRRPAGTEARGRLHEVRARRNRDPARIDFLAVAEKAALENHLHQGLARTLFDHGRDVVLYLLGVPALEHPGVHDHVHFLCACLNRVARFAHLRLSSGRAKGEPDDHAGLHVASSQEAADRCRLARVGAYGGEPVFEGFLTQRHDLVPGGFRSQQRQIYEFLYLHGHCVPRCARARSISSREGMAGAVPIFVNERGAGGFGNSTDSKNHFPSAMAVARAPLKASPAPVASMASTSTLGMKRSSSPVVANTPWEPMVMTMLFVPLSMRTRAASRASSGVDTLTPEMMDASTSLGVRMSTSASSSSGTSHAGAGFRMIRTHSLAAMRSATSTAPRLVSSWVRQPGWVAITSRAASMSASVMPEQAPSETSILLSPVFSSTIISAAPVARSSSRRT